MSQAMVASPSCWHHHLANIQSKNIGEYSFSSVQNTYSFSPLVMWRGRERHRVGDYKEKKMTHKILAMDATSSSHRHVANFESTVWGYHFLSYTSQLTEITTQEKLELDELKEKVRNMLAETPDNSAQKLVLIDTIQRLGVAYHFHNEIETSIQNIFDASQQSTQNDDNLYVVALRFRLLRQQGYYISSDVFKQFTNHDGKFKETTLKNDVQALLSLYEAAHLRIHEEEILEEALTFTTTHLESMLPNLSNSLKVQVTKALNQPIRKTVPRVGARNYIDIYENIEAHNNLLLKFAKLDFNILQKLYQEELSDLTRWWKDLDLSSKFPYARDRLVEVHFWVVGIYFEPRYSCGRRMLTKVIKLASIIDDTFDANYATFDELVLFTDAIQRWDISALDSLPPYMTPLYQALLDVYNEMEEALTKEDKSNRIYYAKYEMKKLVRAYFKEAEWCDGGYIPSHEEYMEVALVTSTVLMGGTTSLVGMEEFITKQTFEWIINEPLIFRASSAICRLMDSIIDHKEEQQRGHVASIVECYMKEHGTSEQEAYIEIQNEVTNAWKDINKEFLRPLEMEVPMFVLERALNLARISHTFFKDEDGYTNPRSNVKELITLLFVESVNV
ncbi:PREDICTED: germacrene C synthase-like [Nicotiana attenuata]|uniref:Germacrene c synthase n=1 Tax=Nicotiana attenuata TaxID=49451 RepID=A0A314L3L5_NICAT|nr:PREDICTED: germacrene C synthase-like [Nicotiana attenuata]OIT35609.1 germacrene c synthase [Nicotiana attenuata]